MQKQLLLLTLVSIVPASHAMNDKEKQTLVSLAPKCISYCGSVINQYRKNLLRASQTTDVSKPFFEHQINKHRIMKHTLKVALASVNHSQLYRTTCEFINLTFVNSLTLECCMWPEKEKPTRQEIALIKKMKQSRKVWVPKNRS